MAVVVEAVVITQVVQPPVDLGEVLRPEMVALLLHQTKPHTQVGPVMVITVATAAEPVVIMPAVAEEVLVQ
jgi:hypothetical protein